MKRWLVLISVGLLSLGIAGCSRPADGNSSQESGSRQESGSTSAGSDGQESVSQPDSENPGSSGESSAPESDNDYSDGWSDEMQGAKNAVTDVLGENYWPDAMVQPEELEVFFGISPDMYEDYLAEMCMINVKVDTLIVLKAGADQIQAAEDALNAYRDAKVSDTMQYPMNLGKIQASVVERHGSYVYFVQLGADTSEAEEEEAIRLCQEANQSAIDALNQYFGVE